MTKKKKRETGISRSVSFVSISLLEMLPLCRQQIALWDATSKYTKKTFDSFLQT
jgi:hypothetical protein